jgi:hypothetical protein
MSTALRTRDSDNITGRLGEVMKQRLSMQGIKQRFISCPASRIATVLTELSYTRARARVILGATERAFAGSKCRLLFISYLLTSLPMYYNFINNTIYIENNLWKEQNIFINTHKLIIVSELYL